jgi:signal transduction histidine kinase/DNA-binding winged helix-turn-helix (wHTH) protein
MRYVPGFRVEHESGRLWCGDLEVALRPKAAAVLNMLVDRAGKVVSKQQLLHAVWPDGFVGDDALAVCIGELRRALADDAREPRYIATVHDRGYRFIAPVSAMPQAIDGAGDLPGRPSAGGLRRTGARVTAVRLAVVQLVVLAALFGFVEIVLVVAGPLEPTWVVVLFPLLAEIYVAAGAVAWVRRPSNRMGALIMLGGIAWLAAGLANTEHRALIAVGQIVATVPLATIVHMLLAFPSGRLRDRRSRMIVVAAYFTALVLQAPLYLFTPERPPYDVLMAAARADLADVGLWVQRIVGSAVMVAAAIVLGGRLRAASRSQRHVLGPLYVYGIAAVLFVPLAFNVVRPLLGVTPITTIVMQVVGVALVPVAFALSILRGGFARTAEIEELGAWLGTDAGGRPALRDALADALGDPSIRLVFWSDTVDNYVDARGRPVALPLAGGDRAAVEIETAGRAVGAIDYDAALIPEPELVRAAGEVVVLALDRERLTAILRANQEELRRSRVRIMEAGDRERRRIAQDLHDGLQPKLVLLAIEASQAGATTQRASIDSVIDELRTLVYGVMSPVLIEQGLYAATEDLVDRMPIPARVVDVPETPVRLSPSVEQAAYFVVAETLANAVRHSQAHELSVRLAHLGGSLRIDVSDDGVGGATPTGVGLRGIADRVDVLGGHLFVDSPPGVGTHIVVEMPCVL